MLILLLNYEGLALNRIIYALVNTNDRAPYTPAWDMRSMCTASRKSYSRTLCKMKFHPCNRTYNISYYLYEEELTSYPKYITLTKFLILPKFYCSSSDPCNFIGFLTLAKDSDKDSFRINLDYPEIFNHTNVNQSEPIQKQFSISFVVESLEFFKL